MDLCLLAEGIKVVHVLHYTWHDMGICIVYVVSKPKNYIVFAISFRHSYGEKNKRRDFLYTYDWLLVEIILNEASMVNMIFKSSFLLRQFSWHAPLKKIKSYHALYPNVNSPRDKLRNLPAYVLLQIEVSAALLWPIAVLRILVLLG